MSNLNCSSVSGALKCFRTAYGPKLRGLTLECFDDLTHQSFKDECDINNIMAQYRATGVVDHFNRLPPQWGEVPTLDFQLANNLLVEASAKFQALPSDVRERFGNNAVRLMQFLQNPDNRAEGEKLGLITPRPAAELEVSPVPASA